MTWAKLDDNTFDSPAMLALERSHRLVYVEALTWACRQLTDGLLPAAALRRLTDDPDPDAAASALVAAGLWSPVEQGWRITDFEKTQSKAADVMEARREARERMRIRRQHLKGHHVECKPRYCSYAERSTERSSEQAGNVRGPTPLLPTPTPTRPHGEGGTEEEKGRFVAALPAAPPPASDEELRKLAESPVPPVRAAAAKELARRAAERNGEAEQAPPTIICNDYHGHRSQHRQTPSGWICDACAAAAAPTARPRSRAVARPGGEARS
jgi:hypothetical protein